MAGTVAVPGELAVDKDSYNSPKLDLKPGQIQLFSYHTPSLRAGKYTVTVDHEFRTADGSQTRPLRSAKTFRVVAPRFDLPHGDIHSFYPPNGHADLPRVLPHVVFEDPHLPWERPMHEDQQTPADRDNLPAAHMPWLGLLSFTSDELSMSAPLPAGLKDLKPSETMAYKIELGALMALGDAVQLPFDAKDVADLQAGKDPTLTPPVEVNAVLLSRKLFEKLFPPEPGVPNTVSLDMFKYMSHVRIVHTHGMAGDVGSNNNQEEYSVTVSPRSGPPEDLIAPVHMIAHLFSLEGIQEHIRLPLAEKTQWIALISLHSWSYQSLPADHVQYKDLLETLGKDIQPLRLHNDSILSVQPDDDSLPEKEAEWLRDRLEFGYSFIKYRPPTGEVTTALYHGPLTPAWNRRARDGNDGKAASSKQQPRNLTIDEFASNNGSDLQLVDHDSGLIDASYHLAWELGRSLASADRVFAGALMRLRADIHHTARAAYLARISPADPIFATDTKRRHGVSASVKESLGNAAPHPKAFSSIGTDRRWNKHGSVQPLSFAIASQAKDEIMQKEIRDATASITSRAGADDNAEQDDDSATGNSQPEPRPVQKLKSSNWEIISKWCINKLMLQNIPTVYLFPEPDYLPSEALRTFYVDETWMNAFIDGALSVANHVSYTKPDLIRQALKENMNAKVLESIQIPTWGFVMRSKVVRTFPNLRVTAPWPGEKENEEQDINDQTEENENKSQETDGIPECRAQIVRMLHLAPDTLLCLFDRRPEEYELTDEDQSKASVFPKGITIMQPPHQQRFSVGDSLDSERMKMELKLLPNKPAADDQQPQAHGSLLAERSAKTLTLTSNNKIDIRNTQIYDWDTRCLIFPNFADLCLEFSKMILGSDRLGIDKACSSWTGLQLNDALLVLELNPEKFSPLEYPCSKRKLPCAIRGMSVRSFVTDIAPPQRSDPSSIFPPPHNHITRFFPFPHPRRPLPALSASFRSFIPSPLNQTSPQPPAPTSPHPSSYLTKSIYSLAFFSRSIPANLTPSTDLVFAINAAPSVPPSAILRSLTALIPAGRDAADLLRVTPHDSSLLCVLPRLRMVGRGLRWHGVARESRELRHYFKHCIRGGKATSAASATVGQRRALPATVLAVHLTPKGGDAAHPESLLLQGRPALGFVLAGCVLNGLVARGVDVLFLERYEVLMEDGGVRGEEESVYWVGVEKEAGR
ncbi:hypothetical protein MMC11_000965 [Xylographa trunciseda]|nr:hypothetical protein [Xylographa trunciseda]